MSVSRTRRRGPRAIPLLMDVPARRNFSKILLERRLELDYSQLEVGQATGLTDTMIGKIERGQRLPDVNHLPALARYLRVDLGMLTGQYMRSKSPRVWAAMVTRYPD